jgi:hypothetical protein
MQRIREQYGVPAHRGREVKFRGERAVILSADKTAAHLWIELPWGSGKRVVVHPTWEMDYLDGEGVR